MEWPESVLEQADVVIPLNEGMAEAFKALSESIKYEQRLEDEVRELRWMLHTQLYDEEVGRRWDYGPMHGELPVEEVVSNRIDSLATRYRKEHNSTPSFPKRETDHVGETDSDVSDEERK